MNRLGVLQAREDGLVSPWPEIDLVSLDGGCELGGCVLFHGAELEEELGAVGDGVVEALAAIWLSC